MTSRQDWIDSDLQIWKFHYYWKPPAAVEPKGSQLRWLYMPVDDYQVSLQVMGRYFCFKSLYYKSARCWVWTRPKLEHSVSICAKSASSLGKLWALPAGIGKDWAFLQLTTAGMRCGWVCFRLLLMPALYSWQTEAIMPGDLII